VNDRKVHTKAARQEWVLLCRENREIVDRDCLI